MGPGKGPTNDDEGFFVYADFKCFRKGCGAARGGPLMMVKDHLFLLISDAVGKGCGAGRGPKDDYERFFFFC